MAGIKEKRAFSSIQYPVSRVSFRNVFEFFVLVAQAARLCISEARSKHRRAACATNTKNSKTFLKLTSILFSIFFLLFPVSCFLFPISSDASPPHPKWIFDEDPITGKLTLKKGVNIAQFANIDRARPAERRVIQADGIEYILVLRVDFGDQKGQRSVKELDGFFFDPNEISLRSYFEENSYGQMKITPGPLAGVFPRDKWYRAPKLKAYYGEGSPVRLDRYVELIRDVCRIADKDLDFSQYDRDGDGFVDHLIVLHAGDNEAVSRLESDIWSAPVPDVHVVYDGVTISDAVLVAEEPDRPKPFIGIYCHEFFHDFGAPDLYGVIGGIEPVGQWDLMGLAGPYQGPDRNGLHPSHIGGYLKWDFDGDPDNGRLGWLKPTEITGNVHNLRLHAFELPPTENKVYKIDIPGKKGKEFFIIENRYKLSGARYDTFLPQSGIVIWHIDETQKRFGSSSVWVEDPGDPDHRSLSNVTFDAAFSAEDKQTSFTPATKPNSNASDGTQSGISITNIGATGIWMTLSVFFGDTYEPNNDIRSAFGPIEYDTVYESFIFDKDDKADFYRIGVNPSTPILISLESIPQDANYDIKLLDSSGNVLALSQRKDASSREILHNPDKLAILYIVVESKFGHSNSDSYRLTVQRLQQKSGELLVLVIPKSYPNPWNPTRGEKVTIEYNLTPRFQLIDEVKLEIYTLNGELIHSDKGQRVVSFGKFLWDMSNSKGSKVASGIYPYLIIARSKNSVVKNSGMIAVEK